ncbi:hypothetical protein IQ238_27095 [Pleurocapsales cyanobacterium LEGE 06147]|nr:hypothetical protein [Pleurocapsales cyanobacterium LEGE 06147]
MFNYEPGLVIRNFKLIFVWGWILILPLSFSALSPAKGQLPLQKDANQENASAQIVNSKISIVDGTYLYGRSKQPEQIGQEYLVMQVRGNRAIGAIYFPRSEFNCFSATFEGRQINLAIVDPYNEKVYPYAIAVRELATVVSEDRLSLSPTLEGYQLLTTISDNDRRMLDTCLNYYRQINS